VLKYILNISEFINITDEDFAKLGMIRACDRAKLL
jgi:hypothetical protein